MIKGHRVLVTGAAGFVGANLVRRLLSLGADVVAVERPGSAGWRLRDVPLRRETADLRDAESVSTLVARVRPECVFHLAAHGGYSWQSDARGILESNLLGTINLLDAVLDGGCEIVVNAGSSSEYGYKDHAPLESEALEPNSDYAVAKAAATLFAGYAGRRSGRRVVTLRLYSVYGPLEDSRRLIPRLIEHGRRGELPPLVDPNIARDFVHVEDVVDAFLAAAAAPLEPGSVYNIGTGIQTTVADMVELSRSVFGIGAEPRWGSMENRLWDASVWKADPRLAFEQLGWRPKIEVASGFRNLSQGV